MNASRPNEIANQLWSGHPLTEMVVRDSRQKARDSHSASNSSNMLIRTTSIIATLALACSSLSCKKATPMNIVGRYTAQRPHGFETLELMTNGTYIQVLTNSTFARTNIGQWTASSLTIRLPLPLAYSR